MQRPCLSKIESAFEKQLIDSQGLLGLHSKFQGLYLEVLSQKRKKKKDLREIWKSKNRLKVVAHNPFFFFGCWRQGFSV